MKTFTDNEILKHITDAQREGAKLILQARHILAESKTGQRDVVTEYDRKVQELLTQRLGAAVEGAKFFCEENDRQDDLNAEHVFIIDPIDGTMNFVHGYNHSCISIAYMSRGQLRAAAIYNPYMDELFTAVKGEGAQLNGKAIRASRDALGQSVVCCGTAPYNMELARRSFALMEQVFLNSLDIRRQGSAALDLCSAASGRAGLYFELKASLWDYAAGLLIVQEAGGLCLDCEGKPMPLDGRRSSVCAGSEKAVREFLAIAEKI